MSHTAKTAGPPPERLHLPQVRLAFGNEGKEPARPATVISVADANACLEQMICAASVADHWCWSTPDTGCSASPPGRPQTNWIFDTLRL